MPVTRTSLWFDTHALEAAEYYVSKQAMFATVKLDIGALEAAAGGH